MSQLTQIPTKAIPLKKILVRPAFQLGMKDAEAGRGFNEKYESFTTGDQWTYERGRQFYFTAGRMRIRQGKGVSRQAIAAYKELRATGFIR
jgi:hypothetical protein